MRTIKSAERTLALFELFSKAQAGLTVGQIAREIAIPQPSVSMLIKNLASLGYLEHDPATRTYIPSVRVVLLGSWIERKFGETQSLVKRLDTVQRRVKETSFIGIQNGAHAQYVMVQRIEKPNRLNVFSGNLRQLTFSASGRALLALGTDREITSWVKRCNAEAQDDRYKIERTDFMRIIAGIRKKGYAETIGDHTPGMGGVAMTFKLPSSDTPLAVGVGGPIQRIKQKRDLILDSLHEFTEAFAFQR
jgi:DNA-binding IclR family transcriptional regulator